MAIYHFSGTMIARSQGRSAVACAAYRSAERLQDERYDRVRDYSRKKDVAYKEILLPEGAPDWMGDREKLWNAVERIEKRKDAQLAREFNVALPRELTLPQNIALVREFVQTVFVAKGMVADLCVHTDKTREGEAQPHAHILLSLREVTAEGFGLKVRAWNERPLLHEQREAWAETVNRHLAVYDHDIRIDHRSNKAQNIDLEPQYKIGAADAREKQARLEDHQRIAHENGEAILKDPLIALHAMTRQQSTFTTRDIACFVHRHTVDIEQYHAVYSKVMASPELLSVGRDAQGRERFSTKTLRVLEEKMMMQAESLTQKAVHPVTEKARTHALASRPLTTEQRTAFDALLSKKGLCTVVGYAGTGKSYLLGAAREAWERSGYQVVGATLSGIAAQGLEAGSGIKSRTLASRLYYWNKGEQPLTKKTILVVDEAGMLGSRQMARVVEAVTKAGAKLVQVGDFEQLQAIEAGAAFRGIAERFGRVELTEIRRQEVRWQKAATQDFAKGESTKGLAAYQAHSHVHEFETQATAQEGLIRLWNDVRISEPHASQIILAYTREETCQLNTLARGLLEKEGILGASQLIKTDRGERLFAPGDRVYFLKNDRGLGVMNGSLGTVEQVSPTQLMVRLDKEGRSTIGPSIAVALAHYPYVEHGYAATIHKAQGVTVDRSYVLASPYLDRHATYVGMTRHRKSADLFWSKEQFKNERALERTLSRERSKDLSLDYGHVERVDRHSVTQPERESSAKEDRLDAFLKAGTHLAQQSDRRQPLRGNLEQFKTQFEKAHPEQAQQLFEATLTQQERLGQRAVEKFQALDREARLFPTPQALKQVGQYAASLTVNAATLDYLKAHHRELATHIMAVAKPYEKAERLALQRQQDRDIGGGRHL